MEAAAAPGEDGLRSGWQPGRGAIAAGVGLVYVAILALNLAVMLLPPRLSLVLSVRSPDNTRISWVLPGSLLWDRGVRVGDRVVRVDGRLPQLRDQGYWRGDSVAVRTGSRIERVAAAALRSDHDSWPLLVLSPWLLLLGTLVFLRERASVGRLAYALFTSAALALALAPAADDDEPLAAVAEVVMVLLFSLLFARFFLAFPVRREFGRWATLLAAPAALAIALDVAAILQPSTFGVADVLRFAVCVAYLLLGLALLALNLTPRASREVRRGSVIVSGGALVSVLPFVVLSLGPEVFGHPPAVAPEHGILALGILPASLSYAILRHQVLPVPLLQRWLVHGVLWLGLLALCCGVGYGVMLIAGTGSTLMLPAVAVLILLLCLVFRWVQEELPPRLDQLLFNDSYDYRASLQRLSRDLSAAGDLGVLGESLPRALCRLMNLEFAALLVRSEGSVTIRGIAGPRAAERVGALLAAVPLDGAVPVVPAEGEPVLFHPLRVREDLVGYLCLGPKATGEPFRSTDRDLLLTLGGQLAALLQNIQLTGDLQRKVRTLDVLNERLEHAREEERAHLAADLHDEPLQTAMHLRRQLATKASEPSLLDLSDNLVDQLRAVCTTSRPVILADLGLQPALERLAVETSKRADIPVTLDAEPTVGEIPATLELILYRAAQEALNNCLHHARATEIGMRLGWAGEMVELCVADDGVGFVAPGCLDDLAMAGHLGLAGLRQRVERAGGRLEIRSAPGDGTVVRVALPAEDT